MTDDKQVFTPDEFCTRNRISRSTYNKLMKAGRGPRLMVVNIRSLITIEAERDWRKKMEAYANSAPAKLAAQRRRKHNTELGKLAAKSSKHISNIRRGQR